MKCNEFWRRYYDKGMSPELEKHLETCHSCADEFFIDRIIDTATSAPVVYSPSESVWERIAAEMETGDAETEPVATPKRGLLSRLFGAIPKIDFFPKPSYAWGVLAVCILSLTTFVAIRQYIHRVPAGDSLEALHELESSEGRYIAAIETLSKQIDARKDEIDPELYDLYSQKLAVLDDYIARCRQAVDENNGNFNARMYLALAYQEKAKTLKEIASLL